MGKYSLVGLGMVLLCMANVNALQFGYAGMSYDDSYTNRAIAITNPSMIYKANGNEMVDAI